MHKKVDSLIQQLVVCEDVFSHSDGVKGFKKWCKATGFSEEEGIDEMFSYPPFAAAALIKIHIKEK